MSAARVERYDNVVVVLHWLMALAIIGLWIAGHMVETLPKGPARSDLIGVHKAVGVVVLVLALARLAWRLSHAQPELPSSMPVAERLLAKAGHLALYLLMVLMPLDGIIMSQSGGHPVSVFGLVLPTLVGKSEGIHHLFEEAHEAMGWVLAVVLAGHVLAALRHRFVLRDGIMGRMLPGR
jgi:cytochrome b561